MSDDTEKESGWFERNCDKAREKFRSTFDKKDWVGLIGSIIATVIGFLPLNATLDDSEYYSVILSSILAIIGVSITGYIFLIEYLRRLKTDRPIYKDAATNYQIETLESLKVMFWIGVILGGVCALFVGGMTLNITGGVIKPIILILFLFFLFKTLRIDLRMMDPENKIYETIERIRREAYYEIRNTDLIVRLNSDEYKETISSWEFTHGIPEFVSENTSESKRSDVITFIHGSDTENMRVKYGSSVSKNARLIIGYRDNSDEYDIRNVLNIFSDVETLLCRILGVEEETVPENISISGILSSSSTQFKEIGMANDIDWYYKKIRRYRDYYMLSYNKNTEDTEYEKRNNDRKKTVKGEVSVTDFDADTECLMSGPWFMLDGNEKDTDLSDKISFMGWMDELKHITPMVFLLRYEISKKLSMKNVSDITLSNYDFSYANMRNTSMRNSYLANASFFHANLSSANLSGSNLREVDFKRSLCDGTNMSGCDLFNDSFAESNLAGSIIAGASVTSCLFPSITMNNCDAHEALILNCRLIDCNLSGSSFLATSINTSVIDGCAVHNSNLKSASITDCSLSGNSFNGSLFINGVMNRSSIVRSTFINTKMTGSEMSALMVMQSDFSNSEMQGINFTETQIMAAEFKSSRLDRSTFNKSSIGPYSLPPEKRKLVRGGEVGNLESNIVIFDHSSMRGCHFTESDISCALLRYVIMEGAEFNNVKISHSSFNGSDLKDAIIIDTSITDCDMDNVSFEGASFTGAFFEEKLPGEEPSKEEPSKEEPSKEELSKEELSKDEPSENASSDDEKGGTTISDCKMTNCNLKGALLSRVTLKNTDITNTSLSGARIVGCTFDGVTGIDYHLLLDAEVLYNITFKGCTDTNGRSIIDRKILDVKDFIKKQMGKK